MLESIDTHALKAIESLQRPGKPDLLTRIVDIFKSESMKSITAMQEGVLSNDLTAVRNAAHTLKSSSAYVGAHVLSQRCKDLEIAAREENVETCASLSEDLQSLFSDSCVELDLYLTKAA